MSTTDQLGNEGTVGERAVEPDDAIAVVDEVIERERNLRPSVEAESQATVDYADDRAFAGRRFGQTLEEEERLAAFEWEVERTRVRWDQRQDSDREARCRAVVEAENECRRAEFAERAASVDRWPDRRAMDAREQLPRDELARVNREAARIAETLDGWSSAAVSRLVAQRVVDGAAVTEAVLAVYEASRRTRGGWRRSRRSGRCGGTR